ncbi:hypothetical protein [Saccharothrix algeriensis]|uniref:Uncharacterized protein n=1 Tax=Saccharothrix algeriensis TaxID=173560 RepID=A0A8T8HVF2_9PSEU|nr:hypothetical protein [Saccharothrix algeriensis]MBM7813913.1 hypothetical protein [Saccharothrix algeriensis]QTR02339.1 hypothetical protein J7S33_24760 [Saccharothrix algeriensis]
MVVQLPELSVVQGARGSTGLGTGIAWPDPDPGRLLRPSVLVSDPRAYELLGTGVRTAPRQSIVDEVGRHP